MNWNENLKMYALSRAWFLSEYAFLQATIFLCIKHQIKTNQNFVINFSSRDKLWTALNSASLRLKNIIYLLSKSRSHDDDISLMYSTFFNYKFGLSVVFFSNCLWVCLFYGQCSRSYDRCYWYVPRVTNLWKIKKHLRRALFCVRH